MVHFQGAIHEIESAFDIKMQYFDYNGFKLLGHTGELSIPVELDGLVYGVGGLTELPPLPRLDSLVNEHKKKERKIRRRSPGKPGGEAADAEPEKRFTSLDYAKLYNYPEKYKGKTLDGEGRIYAMISMGGAWETAKKDVEKYCKLIGVPMPVVKTYYQEGFKEVSTSSTDPAEIQAQLDRNNGELAMDLQVPIAIVPKAEYHIYFVQQNFTGLQWGISTAAYGSKKYPADSKSTPDVMAISWSFRESLVAPRQYQFFNSLILEPATKVGMTIFASSGDWGSSNNTNPPELCVNGPASSPYVVAVGGTRLDIRNDGSYEESLWKGTEEALGRKWAVASGGGFSNLFPNEQGDKEIYNSYLDDIYAQDHRFNEFKTKVGVPDVSALSTSSEDGYFLVLDGKAKQYPGGTSASAPMWAALALRIGQALGKKLGNIRDDLYTEEFLAEMPLNNITDTSKANNSLNPEQLKDTWLTAAGWDPCTGLGTPDGEKLLKFFEKVFEAE